jgi:hypothetical protein
MRFVFMDRIVKLDVPHRIETSKHVSGLARLGALARELTPVPAGLAPRDGGA